MRGRFLSITTICVFATIALAASARAGGGLTVNSTLDEPDAVAGDGNCLSTLSGVCTLRAAIMEANALAGTDTINLPAGVYTLTLSGGGDAGGDLDINTSLVINGAGSATTIVAASASFRVMHVTSNSASVTLSGLTLRNGAMSGVLDGAVGGGLLNAGLTTLDNVVVRDSSAQFGGGGIGNTGTLTLTNSTVQSNTTPFSGGGIANTGNLILLTSWVLSNTATDDGGGLSTGNVAAVTATATLINSFIQGNVSGDDGGGVRNIDFGVVTVLSSTLTANSAATYGGGLSNKGIAMTVTDSTLYANFSGDDGGGIYNETGALTLINSTLSGNISNADGGGLHNFSSTVSLNNVTIADNIADGDANGTGEGGGLSNGTGVTITLQNTIVGQNLDQSAVTQRPDCSGALVSQDYNLIQSTTGCTIAGAVANNIYGQDPELLSFENWGGPTWTYYLFSTSPVINSGNPTGCTDSLSNVLNADQRGFPRPVGIRCDIGAVESDGGPTQTPSWTPSKTNTPTQTLTPTITTTPLPPTTSTPTLTPTATPSPTATVTLTPTHSPTITLTPTATLPPPAHKLYLPILRR